MTSLNSRQLESESVGTPLIALSFFPEKQQEEKLRGSGRRLPGEPVRTWLPRGPWLSAGFDFWASFLK